MSNGNYGLFSDMKVFLSDGVNMMTTTVLVLGFLICVGLCVLHHDIKKLDKKIDKTKSTVNFRYFNMTRSLEDIFNVEIETKEGHVVKKLTVQ